MLVRFLSPHFYIFCCVFQNIDYSVHLPDHVQLVRFSEVLDTGKTLKAINFSSIKYKVTLQFEGANIFGLIFFSDMSLIACSPYNSLVEVQETPKDVFLQEILGR